MGCVGGMLVSVLKVRYNVFYKKKANYDLSYFFSFTLQP